MFDTFVNNQPSKWWMESKQLTNLWRWQDM